MKKAGFFLCVLAFSTTIIFSCFESVAVDNNSLTWKQQYQLDEEIIVKQKQDFENYKRKTKEIAVDYSIFIKDYYEHDGNVCIPIEIKNNSEDTLVFMPDSINLYFDGKSVEKTYKLRLPIPKMGFVP